MTDITIRRATIADIDALALHRASMFRDMGVLSADLFQPLVDATRDYLAEAMPADEYLAWVAVANEKVVAGAGMQLRRILPRPRDGGAEIIRSRQAIVLNVYTDNAFRKRGIANQLMREIIGWTQANQIQSVVLHAAPAARSIYEKLGFVATNEMRLK